MEIQQPVLNNTQVQNLSMTHENENDHISEHHTYRMVVVTVVVLLLGLTIYFINSRTNIFNALTTGKGMNNNFTMGEVKKTVPFNAQKSWIEVSSEMGKGSTNQPLTISIKGFSEGKDINGYDVLFRSNPSEFDIISAESTLPDFQIFQFKKKDHITITGVKNINSKTQTILNNTEFLKIKVQPKKKGTIEFTVLPNSGREKTKFVDVKIVPQMPQIKSVQVAIE